MTLRCDEGVDPLDCAERHTVAAAKPGNELVVVCDGQPERAFRHLPLGEEGVYAGEKCSSGVHIGVLWGICPPRASPNFTRAVGKVAGYPYPMANESFLQARIRVLSEKTGLSWREASLKAELNETAVKAIMNGRSKSPRGTTVRALAGAYGVSVESMTEGARAEADPNQRFGSLRSVSTARIKEEQKLAPDDADVMFSPGPERVRLIRPASLGAKGAHEDVEAGYVNRPPSLEGKPGGYALYVIDDSMAPQVETGQQVHIDPAGVPMPKDTVRVLLKAGGSFLAKLRSHENGIMELYTHAGAEYRLADDEATLERVVGANYLRI